MSTYLINYQVGDIVDIKANAAMQRGMPHKCYHGRTGIVYNVTRRAVGVIIHKIVGNRYLEKASQDSSTLFQFENIFWIEELARSSTMRGLWWPHLVYYAMRSV